MEERRREESVAGAKTSVVGAIQPWHNNVCVLVFVSGGGWVITDKCLTSVGVITIPRPRGTLNMDLA